MIGDLIGTLLGKSKVYLIRVQGTEDQAKEFEKQILQRNNKIKFVVTHLDVDIMELTK
jgi:hypothetical protein